MSKGNEFLPILGKGETYATIVTKKPKRGPKNYPYTYEESKIKLSTALHNIEKDICETPKELKLSEYVVCVRMAEGFTAKSYYPYSLQNISNIKNVGARRYAIDETEEKKVSESKMYFLRANEKSIKDLSSAIDNDVFSEKQTWRQHLQSIETIDLLKPSEKIIDFDSSWNEGRVEIVLHPFENIEEVLEKLFSIITPNSLNKQVRYKGYKDGPIFVSAHISKNELNRLSKFNPLRTVHPMRNIVIPNLRGAMQADAPLPPTEKYKSSIKIGIFDGGADENIPLLKNYVKNYDLIKTKGIPDGISHGTAVCGAALYGPLNNFSKGMVVEVPKVCIESFRVLPLSDPMDIDLYEIIDIIEDTVPKKSEIKIYNISLGPEGPILDDEISRFTYALDRLTYNAGDILFNIAVGNDGDLDYPQNRIQSPSDIVNGLGIGAYTFDKKDIVHAPYSCVGYGREGCKIKPDILAFGGCLNHPIHVVSTSTNKKIPIAGTSFASPTVAGKIGQILATSEQITAQLARALVIHNAIHPNKKPDIKFGYGYMPDSLDDILGCWQNKITILYSGEMRTKQIVKLPVPIIDFEGFSGTASISWTITVLANPNALDSDGYTNTSIEDTFYPNDQKYRFSNRLLKPQAVDIDLRTDAAYANKLLNAGYMQSDFPISSSGNIYKTEDERRKDFKWDTVVKRNRNYRVSSLCNPFLTLHAMGRNGDEDEKVSYYTIVTVEVPKYSGQLYDEVLRKFNRLEAIKIRNVNEIMIPV